MLVQSVFFMDFKDIFKQKITYKYNNITWGKLINMFIYVCAFIPTEEPDESGVKLG